MGDTRTKDGRYQHQEAAPGQPERWVEILPDQCGRLLPRCLHTQAVEVTLDPVNGNVVLAVADAVFSMPMGAAKSVMDRLVEVLPDAQQIVIETNRAMEERRLAAKRDSIAARINAEIDAERDRLREAMERAVREEEDAMRAETRERIEREEREKRK